MTAAAGSYVRPRWLAVRALLPAVLFLYLLLVRTWGITETFVLLGDQILYWKLALGRFRDLPLTGPSSVGTTLGPAFVWIVWGIRHLVGPWTDNLPHAGGIGISILQSAADAVLLMGLWTKTKSLGFALAITLLVATAPFDLSFSAAIWNPPVAVAFVKITIALVCLSEGRSSLWWGLAATTAAILAVQAHSSAIFVAAPVIASFVVEDAIARSWLAVLRRARATIEVVLVLELPYLLNLIVNRPEHSGPTSVVQSVGASLAGSGRFRFRESFQAVATFTGNILLSPAALSWFGALLVVCLGVTAFRLRRDVPMASATVVPVIAAILGYSTWQRAFDQYWFLTLAPSVALTIALAFTAWRPAASVIAVVMLIGVVYAQPARVAQSMTMNRVPEYGALVRGTREIRRRAPEIRAIETEFPLPLTADREFMYTILGGRVTPDAGFVATVLASGDVSFRPAP